jgi:hypothetical protein
MKTSVKHDPKASYLGRNVIHSKRMFTVNKGDFTKTELLLTSNDDSIGMSEVFIKSRALWQ